MCRRAFIFGPFFLIENGNQDEAKCPGRELAFAFLERIFCIIRGASFAQAISLKCNTSLFFGSPLAPPSDFYHGRKGLFHVPFSPLGERFFGLVGHKKRQKGRSFKYPQSIYSVRISPAFWGGLKGLKPKNFLPVSAKRPGESIFLSDSSALCFT